MPKLIISGSRRVGMSRADHFDYMLNRHGSAVVSAVSNDPEDGPAQYVQNHVIDSVRSSTDDCPDFFSLERDFVTEVWFRDGQHADRALNASVYVEQLRPDEGNFVNHDSVTMLAVAEQCSDGKAPYGHGHKVIAFYRWDTEVPDVKAIDELYRMPQGEGRAVHVVRNTVLKPASASQVHVVDEVYLPTEQDARSIMTTITGANSSIMMSCVVLVREIPLILAKGKP